MRSNGRLHLEREQRLAARLLQDPLAPDRPRAEDLHAVDALELADERGARAARRPSAGPGAARPC